MPSRHFFTPILYAPWYKATKSRTSSHAPGASKEEHMDFTIAGITAAALAGYLIYALLHPDKF